MRTLTTLLILIAITACTSGHNTQLKYYDFSHQRSDISTNTDKVQNKYIHVNQVKIQGVSDQQALVQLLKDNSVNIANYHFWSQHPKYTLTDSMTRGLVNKVSSFSVIPAGKISPRESEFTIQVTVTKLAGHHNLGSLIEGQWFIYQKIAEDKKLVSSELFSISTQLQGSGFESLINAHQSSWAKLTESISKIILSKSN